MAHHAFDVACAIGISGQDFCVGHLLSCQENLVHLDRMRKEPEREREREREREDKKIKPQLRGKEK